MDLKDILKFINQYPLSVQIIIFVCFVIIVLLLIFAPRKESKIEDKDFISPRPYLNIKLAANTMYFNKNGISILPYRIHNNTKQSGATAHYKKGHLLQEIGSDQCKSYFEGKDRKDILLPDQESAIHMDEIGRLNRSDSYKLQLIISYYGSENSNSINYFSVANLELHPGINGSPHRIIQKTLDEGKMEENIMRENINQCVEIKS